MESTVQQQLPAELLQLCASFTEPAAWHAGRAVCKVFRDTIDEMFATPEAVFKMLVHMRFETRAWPLSGAAMAGRAITTWLGASFTTARAR